MATMFGFLFMCVTTPMMNIEYRPLMKFAGMNTEQHTVPFGRAFLPNECCWVFDFSWDVEFSLMDGENVIIKVGKTRPSMSIITAATVMTEKSNYHMLVKEGVAAYAIRSTKLWSKSKISNRVVSHGEGLVKTEFSLHHNCSSVRVIDTT
jgi:hypothetical protein